ncbi:cyclic nucleotide-binding domain-containing protein [Lentzea sp. NPDC059081]|uniref:cyclic nucleotide-binding domain-containing protein n=1 Tax=Lentzea sp. NPDC059081 TaxID=3346719 RepID=UPI0036C5D414
METDFVTIVSCDIVGHSTAEEPVQVARVTAINGIVADFLGDEVVWTSGGDGGHVLFWQEAWEEPVLDLVVRLREWSLEARVPLRITCHRGEVRHITGASGGVQPVGAGINDAGALLERMDDGIVATDGFRRAVSRETGIEFHDPQRLLGNDRRLHLVHLMSIGPLRSSWGTSLESDHTALHRAVADGSSWDILYRAKRIWQVSSNDLAVKRCVEQAVEPPKLTFTDRYTGKELLNPFLGQSDRDELTEMLRLGKLVERRRGEFVCRFGDPGDSLFVILRGEVGVFNSEGEGAVEALHTHHPGEIVGELAYALNRERTADLVALTDVALLSFRYEDVRLLSNAPVGSVAARDVASFINYRALQHVSDNAPYLLGAERDGPLSSGEREWDETLASMRSHVELITLSRLLHLSLDDVEAPKAKGIYILAGGALEIGGRQLRGSDFPVLWVNLPRFLVRKSARYAVRSQVVKVLWISARGVDELEPTQRAALHEALTTAATEPERPGSTLNQVGTNTGTVFQIDHLAGDIHVHPKAEPHD